jgi:uncharacterized protein
MNTGIPPLGLGIGWRPELALAIDRRPDLGFIEVIAENFFGRCAIPRPISNLQERGIAVVPHGISLSLGGAEPINERSLSQLAFLAERLNAPFVSEHIAFVRAGGIESGHLLPVSRTRVGLEVLIQNVRRAKQVLPVPLVLENIAALFQWPDHEIDETDFITELLECTDTMLLLDISNLFANAWNDNFNALDFIERLPLSRLAYVHVAGGMESARLYHDTHAHPLTDSILGLLSELSLRTKIPAVLLERDDNFPVENELYEELDRIASVLPSRKELSYA